MTTRDRMTVAVVGLGGIGGIAAAALRHADRCEVVACARRPVDRMVLDRPEGQVAPSLRTLTDPAEAAPVDWVLLCTKAQHTDTAGPWLRALCQAGTRVAVVQNGMDHADRVAPYIGEAKAIPVVAYYNAERLADDHVRLMHITDNDVAVQDDPDGRDFAALMAGTDLSVLLDPDLHTRMWRKLLINVVVNPITALTRQRQRILRRPEIEAVSRAILDEAIAVGLADGAQLAEDERETLLDVFRGFPNGAGSSMYFDAMAGRSLEADALTGAVVRAGRRHGVATPLNEALWALLRGLSESGSAGAEG